ncbi:unnamed protein product [Tenebrio molitor]|nr:unnamed protein product [Tenebrio molitor]
MEWGSASVHLLFSDLGHNSIIVSTLKIVFATMVVPEGTKATWKLVHFSSHVLIEISSRLSRTESIIRSRIASAIKKAFHCLLDRNT